MAAVSFRALCVDAADPVRVARFWAPVLDARIEYLDDGDTVLHPTTGTAPPCWINRVPEAKVGKNRVHLDLRVPDEEVLLAGGAVRSGDHGEFRGLADPEGNEFCAFAAPAALRSGVGALVTDSDRPERIAAWWAGIVGGELGPGPDSTPRYLHGARGLGEWVWKFVPTDDPRVVKNRWHWDVTGDVDALLAAGASMLRAQDDEISWSVLADPDGNEFCVFAPEEPADLATGGHDR